ncbi:hypothetical protein BDFG_08560, partial [Blastomyces dermatitidis ATCC 26199]
TFTILYHSFTNFSHSSIIFFIIIIIEHYYYFIQDYCFSFYLTSSICLSITLYTFLTMISHSYNKYYYSAHIRQFISKSLYIDRSIFTDNSELNIELLIENLKNVIIKKLSVLYVTESSIFFSVSFTTASQSSISVSVSDSLTSATSVSVTLTLTTSTFSGFIISTFIISSSHFKKMLYRLNKLYLLRIISLLNSVEII